MKKENFLVVINGIVLEDENKEFNELDFCYCDEPISIKKSEWILTEISSKEIWFVEDVTYCSKCNRIIKEELKDIDEFYEKALAIYYDNINNSEWAGLSKENPNVKNPEESN